MHAIECGCDVVLHRMGMLGQACGYRGHNPVLAVMSFARPIGKYTLVECYIQEGCYLSHQVSRRVQIYVTSKLQA